jgi:hypothetical protein
MILRLASANHPYSNAMSDRSPTSTTLRPSVLARGTDSLANIRIRDWVAYMSVLTPNFSTASLGIRLRYPERRGAYVTKFDFLESLAPTRKKRNFCGNKDSAFHPMPMSVTANTERNQILQCIMAELTSGIKMMDL